MQDAKYSRKKSVRLIKKYYDGYIRIAWIKELGNTAMNEYCFECDVVELVAEAIRQAITQEVVTTIAADHVWSDVDPNRLWDGSATVEIGRLETNSITDLAGDTYFDTELSVNIKAPSKQEGIVLLGQILPIVASVLNEDSNINTIMCWTFGDLDLFPDMEGQTVRSEFWVIRKINISHR